MFSFRAYFFEGNVYINEKQKYAANEILTAYLNTDYADKIDKEQLISELKHFCGKLTISADMDYEDYEHYNRNVYAAMQIFDRVNKWIVSLPPYDRILTRPLMRLDDILNRHSFIFKTGLEGLGIDYFDWDVVSDFGTGEVDEDGKSRFRLHRFCPCEPEEIRDFDEDLLAELREMNEDIGSFFGGYISFLESYMTIHQIFRPFIDSYLHRREAFPTAKEVAEYYREFNKDHAKNFTKIHCQMSSFGYKILTDNPGTPILCEEIAFDDLQSFLYYDFFSGIRKNHIPNKCKNCGRYFLIRGGQYYNYCDNPLPDETAKTCRDVGSRRRYADKCRNDPIWQAYNRAYKAHYARYMKKKMTVAEFEKWSRYAVELREKASNGEMEFGEYCEKARK